MADSNCAEGITRLSAVLPGRNRHASAVLASIDLRARTTVAMKGDKDVLQRTRNAAEKICQEVLLAKYQVSFLNTDAA